MKVCAMPMPGSEFVVVVILSQLAAWVLLFMSCVFACLLDLLCTMNKRKGLKWKSGLKIEI